MGWFVMAGVGGFLLYRAWAVRLQRPGLLRAIAVIGITAVCAVVAVYLWSAITSAPYRLVAVGSSLRGLLDRLGEGTVARFLLGAVLGFGTGYIIDSRNQSPAGTPLLASDARHVYMSIGLALVIIAAVSPHIDRWLSHLTGLKSSIVEIQLANISTKHKFVLPDVNRGFAEQTIFPLLAGYDKNIMEYLEFVDKFVLTNLDSQRKLKISINPAAISENTDVRDKMRGLQLVFSNVISPIATCVSDAVKRGYSRDSVRDFTRPISDLIAQLIDLTDLAPSPEAEAAKIDQVRSSLKEKITSIPGRIPVPWNQPGGCTHNHQSDSPTWDLLDYTKYKELPQLSTSMAGMLALVGYDNLALRFLEKRRVNLKFHDYQLPYLAYRIMYLRGDPVTQYIALLEEMRDTAHSRLEVVQEVENRCPSHRCDDIVTRQIDKIRSHARHADTLGMNNIAYGIAQDIAAGSEQAEKLEPIALEYIKEVDRFIQDGDASFTNGRFRDKAEREGYRDTIAFVSLVAEARKQNPDIGRIRGAVASLEQVIAYETEVLGSQAGQSRDPDDPDKVLLNTARAHISSARALLED